MSGYVWIDHESWYTLLVFCFFLVKTRKEITQKLSHICKIINIHLFSSQLHEIIIDHLFILAKVIPQQCPGTILIS